jgi:glycosyltransferase involved in cell wall biosynthesis
LDTNGNIKHSRTLVIIPALNEQDSIGGVVRAVQQALPWSDIMVINDGSTDRTAQRAAELGAHVLQLPYNVGIGAAVQTGFIFAKRKGYGIVLRCDGDGQHNPQDICLLIDTLLSDDVDMVIGTRYSDRKGYRSTLARRVGSQVLASLLSCITDCKITDPTSGFAAFNRRAIRFWARYYPHDYPEPEALVIAHRSGLRIREVSVAMKPRFAGRSSLTGFVPAYYMSKVILSILIGSVRPAEFIDIEE